MPENISKLKREIREIFLTKDLREWIEIFKNKDVCVEPVQNLKEVLLEDEHVKDRELVVEVPVMNGEKKIKQIATPIKFSKTPIEYKDSGYPLGYHTDEILEKLGYSKEDIKKLKEKNVI